MSAVRYNPSDKRSISVDREYALRYGDAVGDTGIPPRREIPLDALADWLEDREVAVVRPLEATLIAGGRSNLTFVVTGADGVKVVLRRPPYDEVLATAHDMNREWRFLAALHGTDVPTARPVACDAAGDLLGAPFYVMSFVDGAVAHDARCAAELPVEARRTLAGQLIDVMAALHRVDVEAAGLSEIARHDAYIERQLKRWKRQWDQSVCADSKVVEQAYQMLARDVPPQARTGIVHGDLRLGNVICDPAGSIVAVLDWELATLGDPLADLGWLLSSWMEPGEAPPFLDESQVPPSVLDGFPSRQWLAHRYGELSGADLSRLPFYLAFANWRSACISAGVLTRYQTGAMGDDGFDFRPLSAAVEGRAAAAVALLSD